MAKKPKLMDLIPTLPRISHGATFRSKMSAEQAKEFDELLAWLRKTPKGNWPKFDDIKNAMEQTIGISCSIGTLKREIEGR